MTSFDDTNQQSLLWDRLSHVVLWQVVCRKENDPLKTSQLPSTSLDVLLHAPVWVLVLIDGALSCLFPYNLYNTLNSFQSSFSVFLQCGELACTFQPFKQLDHNEAAWSASSNSKSGKVILTLLWLTPNARLHVKFCGCCEWNCWCGLKFHQPVDSSCSQAHWTNPLKLFPGHADLGPVMGQIAHFVFLFRSIDLVWGWLHFLSVSLYEVIPYGGELDDSTSYSKANSNVSESIQSMMIYLLRFLCSLVTVFLSCQLSLSAFLSSESSFIHEASYRA